MNAISTADLTRLLDMLAEDARHVYVAIYAGDITVGYVNDIIKKYRSTYSVVNGDDAQVFFAVQQVFMHHEWRNNDDTVEYQFLIDVRIAR